MKFITQSAGITQCCVNLNHVLHSSVCFTSKIDFLSNQHIALYSIHISASYSVTTGLWPSGEARLHTPCILFVEF